MSGSITHNVYGQITRFVNDTKSKSNTRVKPDSSSGYTI